MKLQFIALDKLCVSKANMRFAKKAPDVSDILPTVRARGVIQPLIVRPATGASEPDCFEIVAGSRRFHAAYLVAGERRTTEGTDPAPEMLPCAILDSGDDADAIEASLIENIARLAPDEVSQWQCFTRLVREGRGIADIAATFGLPELAVRRVLVLGNLLPRIRELYRREQIDAATVRHLTLASKTRQKEWLALRDDPDAHAPTGYQLKGWLFGGQSIPARHALFDVAASGLETVADLFGEDSYFCDAQAFWTMQQSEVEARRSAFLEAGWAEAIVIPTDTRFHSWEYERAGKRKGGRVYIDLHADGEVVFHEGYVSRKEAARLARAAAGDDACENGSVAVRPELTSITRGYLDLHRHAAARAELLSRPGMALRLMLAHAIAGSPLWRVDREPQTSRNEDVCASLAASRAEAEFETRRRAVLGVLGFSEEEPCVTGGNGYDQDLVCILRRLLELPDPVVMEVLCVVMGETLAAGSRAVDALGLEMNLAMADWWQADEAFLSTLRDREVLVRMVAEVAGEPVAKANAGAKLKVLKAILRDHLEGSNGRARVEGWVPRWMMFPATAYTARSGEGLSCGDGAGGDAPVQAALDPVERGAGDGGDTPEQAAMSEPDETAKADESERLAA